MRSMRVQCQEILSRHAVRIFRVELSKKVPRIVGMCCSAERTGLKADCSSPVAVELVLMTMSQYWHYVGFAFVNSLESLEVAAAAPTLQRNVYLEEKVDLESNWISLCSEEVFEVSQGSA